MAAHLQRTGGRPRGRHRSAPMSEINVTPMVDVMLVLLIIFMVTAPLLTVGVPVDLPQSEAPPINEAEEPLVLTLDIERRLFIQETEIESDTAPPGLDVDRWRSGICDLQIRRWW